MHMKNTIKNMTDVFDPDIEISPEAIARKQRFSQEKSIGKKSSTQGFQAIQQEQKNPRIWFNATGEIVAFGYDNNFAGILDEWITYDFTKKELDIITHDNFKNFYVNRSQHTNKLLKYKILPKEQSNRTMSHQHGLVHAKKITDDDNVDNFDILVSIKNDQLQVSLTDGGRKNLKMNAKVFSFNDTIKIYVTAPMDPHQLLKTYEVPIDKLLLDTFSAKALGYTFKSVYGSSPFAYGRL